MSAIEDELAEVLGSAEAVQRHIAFMREDYPPRSQTSVSPGSRLSQAK